MRAMPLVLLISALVVGCADPEAEDFTSPARLDKGLVLILPGVEGEGSLSHSIRQGLSDAGVDYALKVYQWGRPLPLLGLAFNQIDLSGNRAQGQKLARMIVEYQDAHPNRPVHLIGHSAGGGVVVFAAEALPPGRQIDGLVLLSASLSARYDLSKVAPHVKKGILNFHSGSDVVALMVITTAFGNVDGAHGGSAGAFGFDKPVAGLFEMAWTEEMGETTGNSGGHFDSADAEFVRSYIAPWVKAPLWPAVALADVKK